MAMSRTLIRTYGREDKLSPDEVITQVHRRILSDTQRGIFLTVVFGVLDSNTHTFTYTNAGHNPPFLIGEADDGIHLSNLEKTGPLVGIFGDSNWGSQTLEIKPGEVLVLYTDGISEAQNREDAFYGIDRLERALMRGYDLKAEAMRNALLEDVQTFMGLAPRLDDITLVVIARNLDEN